MKTSLLIFVLLSLSVCINAISAREIPLSEVQTIALRNAQSFWGDVYPDKPIPYYDRLGKLVAWQYNFSKSKVFPKREELLNRIKAEGTNLWDAAWNPAEFAHIILGARTDKPVIISYQDGLSEHYNRYFQVDSLARERFDKNYQRLEEYYIGVAWEWVKVASGDEIRYIKPTPPYMVCTTDEFLERTVSEHFPEKHIDHSGDWQSFLGGAVYDRAYRYIPNHNLMPFLAYAYGCTPTSGAMLAEYYSNDSENRDGHYSRIVDYYSCYYDDVSEAWRYHVSDAHEQIADEMWTEDYIWGMTLPPFASLGMRWFFQDRGHDYWGAYYSWHWDYFMSNSDMLADARYEINLGVPALMNTWNHTMCAMGYSDSGPFIALHDPNTNYLRNINIHEFFYLVKVHPRPKSSGSSVQIIHPDGALNFHGQGVDGETLRQNSVYEITWGGDLQPETMVDIFYSTNSYNTMSNLVQIVSGAPNTGYFPWLVPSNLETIEGRIIIKVKDQSGTVLGQDGSFGDFIVTTGGSLPSLVQDQTIEITNLTYYANVNLNPGTNAWAVIGTRKVDGNPNTLNLYSNSYTNTMNSSTSSEKVNWIAVDANHGGLSNLGIGYRYLPQNPGTQMAFEHGSDNLSIGTSSPLTWANADVVKMYDVYLEPGMYSFSLSHYSGFGNMGFALYGSQSGGTYQLSRSRNDYLGYSDDNPSFGLESFSVMITQADEYGLLVWANNSDTYGTYVVTVGYGGLWTGAVSNDWHNPNNWASGSVPTYADNVMIPGTIGRKPTISGGGTYHCRDLLISAGGWLNIGTATLQVNGSANIYGELKLSGNAELWIIQSTIWHSGSTLTDLAVSVIKPKNWFVHSGVTMNMQYSKLHFVQSALSQITINATDVYFKEIKVDQNTSFTRVSSTSQESFTIGYLNVISDFRYHSPHELKVEGTISSAGVINFSSGAVRLIGSEPRFLILSPNDQFNDLILNCSNYVYLQNNIRINGSFTMIGGPLQAATHEIRIAKDLIHQGGYLVGSNFSVTFFGGFDSVNTFHAHNNLRLNKSNGAFLIFPENEYVACESYQWISGALKVQNNATFIINDLANSSIEGMFHLEGGTINLTQDSANSINLNADLHIHSGNFTINGGNNQQSAWASSRATTFVMEGGILDFVNNSIIITNYNVSDQITGGTIKTTGSFTIQRPGFNPEGGSIEFGGSTNSTISLSSPNTLYNLIVNKSSRDDDSLADVSMNREDNSITRNNTVQILNTITVSNDVYIDSGTLVVGQNLNIGNDLTVGSNIEFQATNFSLVVARDIWFGGNSQAVIANGTIKVGRNWTSDYFSSVIVPATTTIVFTGDEPSNIYAHQPSSSMGNLEIQKTGSSVSVHASSMMDALHLAQLIVKNQSIFNPGPKPIYMSGVLDIKAGGSMNVIEGTNINTGSFLQSGALIMSGGSITSSGSYTQYSTANSQITGGIITIDAPFNGSYASFSGNTTMTNGVFQITNNGFQLNQGGSFNFADPNWIHPRPELKVGWNFRALFEGGLTTESGTVLFIGDQITGIWLHQDNRLPRCKISKNSSETMVYLITDIAIDYLSIDKGSFHLMHKTLDVSSWVYISFLGSLHLTYQDDLLKVGTDLISATPNGFQGGLGTVQMYTGSLSNISGGLSFYKLIIDKAPSGGSLRSVIWKDPMGHNQAAVTTDLIIQQGRLLVESVQTLTIGGNLSIAGNASLEYIASSGNPYLYQRSLLVEGNTSINNNGTLKLMDASSNTFAGDAMIYGNLELGQSTLELGAAITTGTNSEITIGGGSLISTSDAILDYVLIYGSLVMDNPEGVFEIQNSGLQFIVNSTNDISAGTIRLGGSLVATASNVFRPTGGWVEFIGDQSAAINVENNHLYALRINKTNQQVNILANTIIKGDVVVQSGVLSIANRNITCGGNWEISGGWNSVVPGSGTITLDGSAYGGNIHISNTARFQHLILQTENGTCTIGESASIKLLGSLELINTACKLSDNAQMIVQGDVLVGEASLLDLEYGSNTSFSIGGNLEDQNPAFIPTRGLKTAGSSSFILNGQGTSQSIETLNQFVFNHLKLQMAQGTIFTPSNPITINGNLDIASGIWSYAQANLNHTVKGNFLMATNSQWIDNTGTLNFTGAVNSQFDLQGTGTFKHLIINKDLPQNTVTLSNNWHTGSSEPFLIQRGILDLGNKRFRPGRDLTVMNGGRIKLNAGAILELTTSSLLTVQSGGRFETIGSAIEPALVTNLNGMHEFYIQSGATISAEYTIFENMGWDGVHVMNGAYIDPLHAFKNCTFQEGIFFGKLLTIDNNQHFVLENPVFNSSPAPWSSNYNICKNQNWGSLTIEGESGNFAGSVNEWDPFSRVNWSTDYPEFWASSNEFLYGQVNWGSFSDRYLDIVNTGTATLTGMIDIPAGFEVSPWGRRDSVDGEQLRLKSDASYLNSQGELILDTSIRQSEIITRDNISFLLAPGSAMTYQVRFIPSAPGVYDVNMPIYHNAEGSVHWVHLNGTSIGAFIHTDPDTLYFEQLAGSQGSQLLTISNAGNDSLHYDINITYPGGGGTQILYEGFEGAFPPIGWSQEMISGTNALWSNSASTVHPSNIPPYSGFYLAFFNSWTCNNGSQSRLKSPYFSLLGMDPAELSFQFYHDSGYYSSYDRLQVQISVDNGTWQNLGSPIERYRSQPGWERYSYNLSDYSGMSNMKIGLLGISGYGNDIHIDEVKIETLAAPSGWISLNGEDFASGNILVGGVPQQVEVAVNTDGLPSGNYQASIYVYSNDWANWYRRIPVFLSIGVPSISFSESYLSWEPTMVGLSIQKYLEIENTGAIALIGNISTPDGFSIMTGSISRDVSASTFSSRSKSSTRNTIEIHIPSGATQGFHLSFAPTLAQGYAGNLLVSSNAGTDATLALYGSGVDYPAVTTNAVDGIGSHYATCHAEVSNLGGTIFEERGVCWNRNGNPTIENYHVSSAGDLGEYSCLIEDLDPSTEYYARAYAINTFGVSYGEQISFVTLSPLLTTSTELISDFGLTPISSETIRSFTISGTNLCDNVYLHLIEGDFQIALESGHENSEYGYNLNLEPVNGILAETTIYVRFSPVEYGVQESFINCLSTGTDPINVVLSATAVTTPTVSDGMVSDITQTSANLSALVIQDGLAPITELGFCWSTEPDPDLNSESSSQDPVPEWFYQDIDQLEPGTLYYVRAYATNMAGTSFSAGTSFFTIISPQIVIDDTYLDPFASIAVGATSEVDSLFISGNFLQSDILLQAPEGFELSLDSGLREREFSSQLSLSIIPASGALDETLVYVRFNPQTGGFHTDPLLISTEGIENQNYPLTGIGITLPEVSTSEVSELTIDSAVSGGIIISEGWDIIYAKGVCWSTSENPDLDDFFTIDQGEQSFVSQITGLQSNTTYFLRAYLTNSLGTDFGEELSFTTPLGILEQPQNLRISLSGSDPILTWEAVSNAQSYLIYRSEDPYTENWGEPVATVSNPTWTDSEVSPSAKYFYKVIASSELAR